MTGPQLADSLTGSFHLLPQWVQAPLLYVLVSMAFVCIAIILHGVLWLAEWLWRCGLKRISRWLPIDMSSRCARLVAQGEIFFIKSKIIKIGRGGAERNHDPFKITLRRQPQYWMANILATLAIVVAFLAKVLLFMLQINIINIIIWTGILWYVGYLPSFITWISQLDVFDTLVNTSPSQIAAVLGLIVIFSAVLLKSDIRGRTEFSKVSSLECRKTLNLLAPHISALYVLEVKHQENITSELSHFPSKDYLQEATGHHGLQWRNGRISRDLSCKDSCHANLHRKGGYVPHFLLSERHLPNILVQEKIEKNLKAAQKILQDLDDLGYSYKIPSIIPRGTFMARHKLKYATGSDYNTERFTLENIEKKLAPHQFRLGRKVRHCWSGGASAKEQQKAVKLLERLIGRVAAHARDEIWESFLAAERLRQLHIAIIKSKQDRIIDRLKQ